MIVYAGSRIEGLAPSLRVAERIRLTIAGGNRTKNYVARHKPRLGECPSIDMTLPPPLRGSSLREGGKGAQLIR